MKKFFVILSLLSTFCLFSQTKVDTIQPILEPININANLNTRNYVFGFNQLNFYTKNDFSVYNRATMMNDNFSVYKGQFEYKNSIFIPENTIYNSKIDSFNPNGVSDFGSALLTGVLNLTLSLFNTK
ncbi:hypothetical protein FBBAL38_06755 [Flavobacteria bacterium BAL38]|uniref:hypothetical protein n=1 Tax=unclassified Flavobacterium TaxID=196869 RepID=UPI0000F3A1C2|nr:MULTISPECIES: hypothetical protein [unclassified Flavobacterium]EAZ95379.1 hypothetical protein FBBAL38_06755 [Flavobacteria bacterium BAL38]MQP51231.1 hypothetical protein [Flavobacterium sp. LMO9]MQP61540.1 hypothetical protein [Flavobacterium sp. LMO6]